MKRILTDKETGSSGFGSTMLKKGTKCLQEYAYAKYGLSSWEGTDPMNWGSGMHYVLAHHNLRKQAAQRGEDPETWEAPIEALRRGIAAGYVPALTDAQIAGIVTSYEKNWTSSTSPKGARIVAAEHVYQLDFGLLDMPGHPDHGQPIVYAPRVDLVDFEEKRGELWFTDYKSASSPSARTVEAYRIDWQFILMERIRQVHYPGHPGGVRLRVIESVHPYSADIYNVTPTRHLLDRVDRRYVDFRHTVARLELETLRGERTAWDWPAATQETVCVGGRYGTCKCYDLCYRGPKR